MHDDPKENPEGGTAPESEAQRKLTEALLAEHARAGANVDEDFLAGVDKALESPVVELPMSSRNRVSSWWRAAAILVGAALIFAVGLGFGLVEERKREAAFAEAKASEARAALVAKVNDLNAALASKNEDLIASVAAETKAKNEISETLTTQLMEAATKHEALAEELEEKRLMLAEFKDLFEIAGPMPVSPKPAEVPAAPVASPTPATQPAAPPSVASGAIPAGRDASPRVTRTITLGAGMTQDFSTYFGVRGPRGYLGGTLAGEADAAQPSPFFRGDPNTAPVDRENYGQLVDNRWQAPLDYPLSTFSVDVDTASYTNLRRMIRDSVAVPKDAVRIEEMINYFDYDYPAPRGEHPFAFAIETASAPWNENHRLVRVGLKAKDIARERRPPANLVFLLDVSGSMDNPRKLPLVIDSMKILVEELNADDVVSIVVYAGAEGLALEPTRGSEKKKILAALTRLKAGGSTNGGAGIDLAYRMAAENFIEDGVNRVILCTDGDFNVGRTVQGDLVEMVEERARGGTFLSVLGFGAGNINDAMLEAITNRGNGTYYYVDCIAEGRKVFLEDLMSTLVAVAVDVKIQVEFNPSKVEGYRLIGYANRMLEAEDFEDDTVDAGEVGAGHRVTALYEIIPAGTEENATPPLPELKYQRARKTRFVPSEELLTVKLRYKEPDGDTSKLVEAPVVDGGASWKDASDDFQFASAVALFGMILRESEYTGESTLVRVIETTALAQGADPYGRRKEFRELVALRMVQR